MAMNLMDRFESKYIPEPNSGCFLWTGARHRQGYGQIVIDRKTILAHRLSWEIYCGSIPDGMNVLHQCDNCGCVYTSHLFLGTQSYNMADCGRKGSSNKKGSVNGNAKLTEDDVRYIRSLRRTKYVCVELAEKFGMAVKTIQNIRGYDRSWKHI